MFRLNRVSSLTLSCYLPGMGLGRRKSRTFLKPLVSSELLIASIVGRNRSVGHTDEGKIPVSTVPLLYLPKVPVSSDLSDPDIWAFARLAKCNSSSQKNIFSKSSATISLAAS